MLRNRYWWTWRLFVAFLFLSSFYSPAAQGAPLWGLPPLKPGVPPGSKPPAYSAPSTYTISGYVFIDAAKNGIKLPSSPGISAVQMQLFEYSPSDLNTAINFYTACTNSAGYYTFGNLHPGDVYALREVQPAKYTDTLNTVGYYLSSTGGTLAAPLGWSNGILVPQNIISGIGLPPASGAFTPSPTGGKYAAVNYLFGESAPVPPKPPIPPNPPTPPKPPKPPTPPVTSPAILSTTLAVSGTNNRFLADGPGLGLTGTVKNAATQANASSLSWISSFSSGMSFGSPTTGTGLAAGKTTDLGGVLGGTVTSSSSGIQIATLTVSGTSSPSTPLPSINKTVVINPVFSRGSDATSALSVTTADFGRLMLNGTASSNLTVTSNGSRDNYSDLTMNVGSMSVSDSNGTAIGTNSTAMTFNGTNTTNSGVSVIATLTTLGSISGTMAIPGNPVLFTGEKLASGTPVLPTLNVPYKATVVEQRQLAQATDPVTGDPAPFLVPSAAGGLLYGAVVSADCLVKSTNFNADTNHATSVYVTGGATGIVDAVSTSDGTTLVGKVSVTQTKIDSAGNTTVPVMVEAGVWGPISGSTSLSVVTAENGGLGLIGEGTYAPVSVAYKITNVGGAATGGADPLDPNKQLFGAPLSAPFKKDSQISPSALVGSTLSSYVSSVGTAGTASTAMNTGNTDTLWASGVAATVSNVHGTVGSQCDILASTKLSSDATVTMAWRNRDNAENGSFTDFRAGLLPAGVQWLTSDVVNIAGVPKDLTFAMQMTFDDSINAFIEPSQITTIADSYIGKMVNGKWENAVFSTSAGSLALPGFAGSLSTFLAAANYDGTNLADLAGSWGVDLNPGGIGYSWAIVNGLGTNGSGGGEFAVVPEPSTLALLGACVAGLLVYRVRRKARNKSLEV
ncbi:MAG: SdrD B-like domain-containing protein [Planctomycetota bacterium]